MSDTPRCDEFAAKLPGIPWSGNETESVRGAVYSALAAWSGFARELEREIYSEIEGHAAIAELAARDPDSPEVALGKSMMGRAMQPRSGLAKAAIEASRTAPPPDRNHAPNPKNANRNDVHEPQLEKRTASVPGKRSHKKRR